MPKLEVHFKDFTYFRPEREVLDHLNQLVVEYSEKGDYQRMDVIFSDLRLVFIYPIVKSLFKFYTDLMVDMYIIPKAVEEHMKGQHVIPLKNPWERYGGAKQPQHARAKAQSSDVKVKKQGSIEQKKTFAINKKYKANEEQKHEEPPVEEREERGSKMFSMIHLAKHQSHLDDKKMEGDIKIEEEEKLVYERRIVSLRMKIKSSNIEILIPSNLYDKRALALKISTKFLGEVKRKTEYKDAYLPDKWKTWRSTIIESDHQEMNSVFKQLQIFVENPVTSIS